MLILQRLYKKELLHTQLQTLGVHFQEMEGSLTKAVGIFDAKRYFLLLSHAQAALLSQVSCLLQLILVMLATNATSERSFSCLHCLKNFLRTTMSQRRLNHLMLLHVHKERTDSLDLRVVLNAFFGESEHRSGIFAKYQLTSRIDQLNDQRSMKLQSWIGKNPWRDDLGKFWLANSWILIRFEIWNSRTKHALL